VKSRLLIGLATSGVLLSLAAKVHGGPVGLNETAVPDSSDNKAVKIDNSKEKELPPIKESWCQTPPPWEIRVGLPGWLAGISGETGVKGVDANEDIRFEQLLTHLTHFPLVLSVDARYQRWEFFGDGQYMEVGDAVSLPGLLFTNANIHLISGLAEGFIGFRLIHCDKASLSIFAGARYTYMDGKLNINDNGDARLQILRQLLGLRRALEFEDSIDWTDPVVGTRGKVKVWKAFSLYAEGDVGGFDANSGDAFELRRQGPRNIVKHSIDSSDWSYQVQGGLEIQLTRSIWTQIGWRYLKYDFNIEGFVYKPALNGPFIQAGINF